MSEFIVPSGLGLYSREKDAGKMFVENANNYILSKNPNLRIMLNNLNRDYNLKPMRLPFIVGQDYYYYDNETAKIIKSKCFKMIDGGCQMSNGARVKNNEPAWYRSGINSFFNRNSSASNYGGKRRKLLRKKSQKKSIVKRKQRTQRRSRGQRRQGH